MKLYNRWSFHLIIRLLIFPVFSAIIYYALARDFAGGQDEGIRISVFGAASITTLILMAESLLLFQKRRMNKLCCNIGTILFVILFILFIVPTL